MISTFSIALIVNTYNQPEYLRRVLRGISKLSVRPAEVLIADDGSTDDTKAVIEEASRNSKVAYRHIWQTDDGFRRAQILNKAVASTACDYVIFLDGDTVPHPDFVRDHGLVARPGCFVQGHRSFIGKRAAERFGYGRLNHDRGLALLKWQLDSLRNAFRWPYPVIRTRNNVKGVRGCNLGIWRKDLEAVNGYNEEFVGWGREDTDLTLRLLNRGLQRIDVRGWAVCYHLWHPTASRSRLNNNDNLLAETAARGSHRCACGLDKYLLPARGIENLHATATGKSLKVPAPNF
jgi:glycosyltransferase involved in cell wall biosynthesis